MKTLTRQEFLKLPEGTLYLAESGELCAKRGLIEVEGEVIDFIEDIILGERVYKDGDATMREGLYDETVEYHVLDKEDIETLIERLKQSL